jgi:hypothetical protein
LVVDEGADAWSLGDDAVPIPLAIENGLVRVLFILGFGRQPSIGCRLPIDITCLPRAGFNFYLGSMETTDPFRPFRLLVVTSDVGGSLLARSNLHARVEGVVDFDLKLQFKVAILFFAHQERIRTSFFRGPLNRTLDYLVFGFTMSGWSPAFESGSIE